MSCVGQINLLEIDMQPHRSSRLAQTVNESKSGVLRDTRQPRVAVLLATRRSVAVNGILRGVVSARS